MSDIFRQVEIKGVPQLEFHTENLNAVLKNLGLSEGEKKEYETQLNNTLQTLNKSIANNSGDQLTERSKIEARFRKLSTPDTLATIGLKKDLAYNLFGQELGKTIAGRIEKSRSQVALATPEELQSSISATTAIARDRAAAKTAEAAQAAKVEQGEKPTKTAKNYNFLNRKDWLDANIKKGGG